MDYSKICKVYAELEATSKGLEKTDILAGFLGEIRDSPELIYLLRGKLFADYDNRELGVSHQLAIKAISRAAGISEEEVVENFKKLGDLGSVAEKVLGEKKKQKGLFEAKLSVEKVIENLKKLPEIEGSGAVDLKIGYIVNLLHSASANEAKYVVRTVLGDLKIGVGLGILRDAVAVYCFKPEGLEDKKACAKAVQEAYDKATDFAEVFERAREDKLEKIKLVPGKPLRVMLFPKAKDVEDAFRIVGRPAAFEYKYDGFRVMVNKGDNGEVKVFTRALEDVTKQFPEIVEYVESHVMGRNFILDCEAVGFDAVTGEYTDFQMISQRIRRKYEIDEMRKRLPVELVVFDIVFLTLDEHDSGEPDGDNLIDVPFIERRKILERIVREEEKKIVLARQIVTSDSSEVETFYNGALDDNQEGLMGRRLDAPYKPGARIGYAVKLKPEDADFDLVITGAEWGTGKRAGWLTSFDIACRNTSGCRGVGVSGCGNELGNKVIFMCGKDKTPDDVWYPWFGKEVRKKGFEFVAPKLPKIHDPVLEEWLEELDKTKPNENSILVGHSRGGMAIMRWLEKLPKGKKVKKVILLAVNNPDVGEKDKNKDTHGFYEVGSYDFEKIKSHCDDFVVIHSEEDPWVSFKSGENNANGLGAKFKAYEGKLHFGKNLNEVPELLEEIEPRTDADSRGQNEGDDGELLGIGKVSTGLKELKSEGLSFGEMTDMLEKLVTGVKGRHVEVRPEVVVSVRFQDVQKSPTNSSGFALRFPRILRLRSDRGVGDIATVGEVGGEVEQ